MVARRCLFALLSAAISVSACATSDAVDPVTADLQELTPAQFRDGFVTRSGTELRLAGKPFRMVGMNFGGGCDGLTLEEQTAQYKQTARDAHINTVRTWWLQAWGGPADFSRFDREVALARSHGVKLVVTLGNQWGQCEPLLPNGATHFKLRSWYEHGYRNFGDPGYALPYKKFVEAVVARYASEPAVAMFQLMNEAEAPDTADGRCNEDAAARALTGFATDMLAAVRAIDTQHLVSLGTQGAGQCGTAGDSYRAVHATGVDVCEYHDYSQPKAPMPVGGFADPANNGLARRLRQCKDLGLPLFVGEAGILFPDEARTTAERAFLLGAKVGAAFGGGAAGYLLWHRGFGESKEHYIGPGELTESMLDSYANPTSWRTDQVGGPNGFAAQQGSELRLASVGADIWYTKDAFTFVHTAHDGDVTVQARVESMPEGKPWAKAGVMLRASLSPSAAHVSMVMTPVNGAAFLVRTSDGSETSIASAWGLRAPYWVRVTRTSNAFVGSVSSDGQTWKEVGKIEGPAPSRFEAGVVASGAGGMVRAKVTKASVR
ncbi:MAG: cellulase family glycosylhydrolase [Polyangiaceae bacterium]